MTKTYVQFAPRYQQLMESGLFDFWVNYQLMDNRLRYWKPDKQSLAHHSVHQNGQHAQSKYLVQYRTLLVRDLRLLLEMLCLCYLITVAVFMVEVATVLVQHQWKVVQGKLDTFGPCSRSGRQWTN